MRLPITTADAPESEKSWRWQAQNAVTTLEELERALRLTEDERQGVRYALAQGFPLSVTPYYLKLMDPDDPSCPLRIQCVPQSREATLDPGDLVDPLGEEEHEVAPHLVRRYPDRVLLIATDRCALYCRHCTRSRLVGQGGGARSMDRLEPAFRWIEEHAEIRDVIVSGGDPLVMSDRRIRAILERLRDIDTVDYVRLATRAPVTIPQRITPELARLIREAHPAVWVMTHFNHPKELTAESKRACETLVDHGIPVMNQAVLLRGVNDSAPVLKELFRTLVKTRVRPYYLLQSDPVRGTSHLRTPLQQGLDIMAELHGHMSGLAVPKFIVDTPGGRGKVHLAPEAILERAAGSTTLKTFRGESVKYYDPRRLEGINGE